MSFAIRRLLPGIGWLWFACGCAGIRTSDEDFPDRFTGTFRMADGGFYAEGDYRGGFPEGLLSVGKEGVCKRAFEYHEGKLFGRQTLEDSGGRIRIYMADTAAGKAGSIDSAVDAEGKRWSAFTYQAEGDGKVLIEDNRFYGVRRIKHLKDTVAEGMEYVIDRRGDTLCREEYRAGKAIGPDLGCERSTESILKVVRNGVRDLHVAYNARLRSRHFDAKIYIKLGIAPDGTVAWIMPERILTSDTAFVRRVLTVVSRWRYPVIRSPSMDVLTVPFSFTE